MQRRTWLFGFGLLTLLGCSEAVAPIANDGPASENVLAQAFDRATTGTIRGRVLWDGDVPASEKTLIKAIAYHFTLHQNPVRYDTPHVPRVHAENRGVADAVVFLRGLDPSRCKPWSHDALHIEFRDRQLRMSQGAQPTNVGFVRRGGKVTTVSRDADYHALRGRGAAFFTLPLMITNQMSEQNLRQNGLVELLDAAGYYWVRAHLFVDEHPYYARTDADGNFVLEQVPDGTYEIVNWMPSWRVTKSERDPETGVVARLEWAPPVELQQKIRVQAGRTEEITFRWSQKLFGVAEGKK